MRFLIAATAVAITGFLLPHNVTSHSSARCSLVPGFFPGRGVLMLATPGLDTLRAGPGDLPQGGGPGHSGNGRRPDVFGQRFSVHRISGDSARGVEGIDEAVLVPWDYDASCAPVPWARSARWLDDSDTVLLSVRRRSPEHWANGIPTFDVSPVPQSVYRGDWWEGRPTRSSRQGADSLGPVNSPEQYYEFLRRVPPSRLLALGDERVLDSLQAWMGTHPEIGSRDPARRYLTEVRRDVRTAWLMRQEVPFFGTWELRIRLRSGAELRQWMRTTRAGIRPWDNPAFQEVPEHVGPDGFSFFFLTAPTLEALPTVYPMPHRRWPMEIESRDPSRERHWRFGMQLAEFEHMKGDVPELGVLMEEWIALWKTRWAVHKIEGLVGEIMMTSDSGAVMRIAWDTDGDSVPDLTVTGRRMSSVTADSARWRDR